MLGENIGGKPDQRIDVDLRGFSWFRSENGGELQRPHATRTRVAESFDGAEALRRSSCRREPGVNQRVAEAIRE